MKNVAVLGYGVVGSGTGELFEKNREAISYDYKTSGIDYNKGTEHLVSGTHFVKCTDDEFKEWTL